MTHALRVKASEAGAGSLCTRLLADGTQKTLEVSSIDAPSLAGHAEQGFELARFQLQGDCCVADIRLLDEPAKPFGTLKWANDRALDLAGYMKEHPYMYSSGTVRVKFRVVRAMISDVRFSDISSGQTINRLICQENGGAEAPPLSHVPNPPHPF